MLLDDGKRRTRTGRPTIMSDAELEKYGEWFRGLTPLQKLDLAIEGKL